MPFHALLAVDLMPFQTPLIALPMPPNMLGIKPISPLIADFIPLSKPCIK